MTAAKRTTKTKPKEKDSNGDELLTFKQAEAALDEGKRIYRLGWTGNTELKKGQGPKAWVYKAVYHEPDVITGEPDTQQYILFRDINGLDTAGWLPSTEDSSNEDWVAVE